MRQCFDIVACVPICFSYQHHGGSNITASQLREQMRGEFDVEESNKSFNKASLLAEIEAERAKLRQERGTLLLFPYFPSFTWAMMLLFTNGIRYVVLYYYGSEPSFIFFLSAHPELERFNNRLRRGACGRIRSVSVNFRHNLIRSV